MRNHAVINIESKINSISNYNGQLSTLQANTQEAYSLLRFALNNELIDDQTAEELFSAIKNEYQKAISNATFENIIKF